MGKKFILSMNNFNNLTLDMHTLCLKELPNSFFTTCSNIIIIIIINRCDIDNNKNKNS